MNKLYLTLKESWKEGKKVQALVGVSLFTALNIILSSYASIRIIPNVLTISFASVAVAAQRSVFRSLAECRGRHYLGYACVCPVSQRSLVPRLDDQRHVYRLFLRYRFFTIRKRSRCVDASSPASALSLW